MYDLDYKGVQGAQSRLPACICVPGLRRGILGLAEHSNVIFERNLREKGKQAIANAENEMSANRGVKRNMFPDA